MKARTILLGVLLLPLSLAVPAWAQTANPQQTLQQYVADLQRNPNDTALRGKIIALAQTMNPAPAIPEEAREHYVMAATFIEQARDTSGFERAVSEYKAALLAAPWWADVYKKLAIAQKAAGHYDDAIASLNLYLLTQPADARDAQDEIYKLKALKLAAADQAQTQRDEYQRAYESSPEGKFQALLTKINGRRYSWTFAQPSGGTDTRFIEVKGNVFVMWMDSRGRSDGWNGHCCESNLEITGRETTKQVINTLDPRYNGYLVYTISDNGEQITVRGRNQAGGSTEEVYLWQR